MLPEPRPNPNPADHRDHVAPTVAALLAVSIAGVALLGWLLGLPRLTTWLPARPSMSPMTVAMVVLGAWAAAAFPRRRRMAVVVGLVQAAASVGILAAHAVGLPQALGAPLAWWSSPITGAVFLASGTATTLMAARRLALGQVTALVVLLAALLLGLGHVFPNADLYRYVPGTGVAIPTVTAFVLLSMCQVLACRRHGVVGALTSSTSAGHAGLLLLCAGCLGILLLAAVVLRAQQALAFDADTAVLLAAWGAIAVLVGTLWALAVAVDRADDARRGAERQRDEVRQWVAAAITHDLRSPLMAASMSTVLLRRQVQAPAVLATIERMERSHHRMDRLLRTLMDALAADGERPVTLKRSTCRLAAIVDAVVQEHQSLLSGRVHCEGDAEGWWDAEALTRVVENLLINAVKYGAAATPIRCRIAVVPQGMAVLTIENQGHPIPRPEWESIFQPFARGRRDEPLQTGWGVGLAFARSVAVAHGGSARVDWSDERGTGFVVRLPVRGQEGDAGVTVRL